MSDKCAKCEKACYPGDNPQRINGLVFHNGCFKCYVCDSKLTMRTFKTNPDASDKGVYCLSHDPLKRVHQDASQEASMTMIAQMSTPSKADAMGSVRFKKGEDVGHHYGAGAIGTEGSKVKPDAIGRARII